MTRRSQPTIRRRTRPAGAALMVAVLVLTVLVSLLAALSMRLSMAKRRQEYMIAYQQARYAMDSAMKYALSVMPEKTFSLADRKGLPDYSDMFWMTRDDYRAFIENWALDADEETIEKVRKEDAFAQTAQRLSPDEIVGRFSNIFGLSAKAEDPDAMDAGDSTGGGFSQADAYGMDDWDDALSVNPDHIKIPGPYGPPWPNVIEPIELRIGAATVTITIEDENAKLPLAWAALPRQTAGRQADAAIGTFFDWMGISPEQQRELSAQLAEIQAYKTFEINPELTLLEQPQAADSTPTTQTTEQRRRGESQFTPSAAAAERAAELAAARQAERTPEQIRTAERRQIRTTRQTTRQRPQTQQAQDKDRLAVAHSADFAKLLHSALVDREQLARPTDRDERPNETPLKYVSLWGTQRVNVNTAPRHVLEAALTFGGDPVSLAERIIQQRQAKPIESIDDLKQSFYGDSQTVERAKDYLTTQSNFFTIRVVSRSGNARMTAVAAIVKEGQKVQTLAVLYGF